MGGKKPYFPMFVDISKKKILVIGGGKIAERRVETLLKFADNITVISPEMTERLLERAKEKRIRWIPEAIDMDDAICAEKLIKWLSADVDIVLAVTDNRVCNEQVVHICRERGILTNASHKKELCDFYFPAVVIKDSVTVGITSGGQSHMQVKKMREQIEAALSESDTEL